jgi:hypothetical protein
LEKLKISMSKDAEMMELLRKEVHWASISSIGPNAV